MYNKQNKIIGSIMGGSIGDALGYPIEFTRGIKDREYCKYFDDKGIISDDTQMTLFTANALLFWTTRGHMRGIAGLPVNIIYLSYLEWLKTQNEKSYSCADEQSSPEITWIKKIEELNVRRCPGNTCLSALSSGNKGTIENPINNSKGCGGVMRVSPIGLYIFDALDSGRIAAEASALTHGHPLGIIPSYIFAAMLYYIVNENENIYNALSKSIKQYKEKYNIFKSEDSEYFFNLIEKAVELSKENISDVKAIKEIGEGWVAEEAFAIALYSCLKYENSFEDAVICATNHDGDSDSTGAIAGNIIGAYLGYEAIPSYYIDNIELKDIIIEIATDLSIDVPVSEYKINNDKYWISKYCECRRNPQLKKAQTKDFSYSFECVDCIYSYDDDYMKCKKYQDKKPLNILEDLFSHCEFYKSVLDVDKSVVRSQSNQANIKSENLTKKKSKINFLTKLRYTKDFDKFINSMSEILALDLSNEMSNSVLEALKAAIAMAKEDKISAKKIKKAEDYIKQIEDKLNS